MIMHCVSEWLSWDRLVCFHMVIVCMYCSVRQVLWNPASRKPRHNIVAVWRQVYNLRRSWGFTTSHGNPLGLGIGLGSILDLGFSIRERLQKRLSQNYHVCDIQTTADDVRKTERLDFLPEMHSKVTTDCDNLAGLSIKHGFWVGTFGKTTHSLSQILQYNCSNWLNF